MIRTSDDAGQQAMRDVVVQRGLLAAFSPGSPWEPEAATTDRRHDAAKQSWPAWSPEATRSSIDRSCPSPVPPDDFRQGFNVLEGVGVIALWAGIVACMSCARTAIPVGGDVAEWSKALPC